MPSGYYYRSPEPGYLILERFGPVPILARIDLATGDIDTLYRGESPWELGAVKSVLAGEQPWIYFEIHKSAEYQLWRMTLTGESLAMVADDVSDFDVCGVNLKLAYVTRSQELIVAELDGSSPQVLSMEASGRVTFSPDGGKIALNSKFWLGEDYRWGLFIIGSDGTGPRHIYDSHQDLICSACDRKIGWACLIAWSPDGSMLAISSWQRYPGDDCDCGDRFEIWLADSTLSQVRRIWSQETFQAWCSVSWIPEE